tara:strand:+ start:362 stop:1657 length:1296 start_codon:yes stop_codon:yes gene_type:complete
MDVSREYIDTEQLVEFPINKRFLKLPVDKFFENEGVELIPPQIALINAINDPAHRFVVGCLSRRTGKTFSANHIAFLKAMEPNTQILIISPNYSLSNISWNEQIQLIKKHDIETLKMNAKDKEILLENNSLIKLGSVSQANSCVGRSYDLILFDEAALDPKGRDAFNIQLRPTLDKDNSKAIFISTPRGTNYFHDFYNRGFGDKFPFWASIHSTWRDNPRTSEADIEEAKLTMSNAEFKQEYEADFTTFEGQIYEGFDYDRDVKDLSDINFANNKNYDGIMGIDAGYKDPTAAVQIYYAFDTDTFYITQEYLDNERTTEQHAKYILEMFDGGNIDFVFCDSAAAQFRHDLAELYDIPSNPSKKSVLDGIAYVQSLVDTGKVKVDPSCKHVIEMLTNYRWDPRPELLKPKPVHDQFSHIADAIRYALYSFTK